MLKQLSYLKVPADNNFIGALLLYINQLAIDQGMSEERLPNLDLLVEDLFRGILQHAIDGKINEPQIEITVSREYPYLVLEFHYRGIPYGYRIDAPQDKHSTYRLALVRALNSSFYMREDGKAGQRIVVKIRLTHMVPEEAFTLSREEAKQHRATDATQFRHIVDDDMESLIQCLYSVFGYNYSSEEMYDPSALRTRKKKGLYEGIVATNEAGKIVAHVGMLKINVNDKICESGQAFVMPQYGARGLFHSLKKELIEYAETQGLYGVFSNAMTGHPYTQRVNIQLNCAECGLGLSYIPADLESQIKRSGEGKRQPVMRYFIPTIHAPFLKVYLPSSHEKVMRTTYEKLHLNREIRISRGTRLSSGRTLAYSVINSNFNYVFIAIKKAGKDDLVRRVEMILRSASSMGCAVAYLSLSLANPSVGRVVRILEENCGFSYAGIMPYEDNGMDVIHLQCLLAPDSIQSDEILTESEWGRQLKEYVLSEKEKRSLL